MLKMAQRSEAYTKYSSSWGPGEIHFMDQAGTIASSLCLDDDFIFVIKWHHMDAVPTKPASSVAISKWVN